MSEQEWSPEFIERFRGGEVEVLEGDVEGAFDAEAYEDSEDDGDDIELDDEGPGEDTDDPNEGAV